MNNVILTGNLGTDVESFYSPNDGIQIVSFPLAFRKSKDKTGWIKITCFNKVAELAEKHLHKGARIGVAGMLDQDKWEKNGETKTVIKVIANSIEFIKTDGRGFDNKETKEQTKTNSNNSNNKTHDNHDGSYWISGS
ncbi:MAG: single-stranded DNA-binding protein [Desulfobacterales bacterium]|nr:single-stranded DNA-binding protein [Desulfobacterales bacterium]